MKTDKLFYRIFLSQPDLISELLPGIPPGCEFDYSAPVVKEREIRLDGLLTPVSADLSLPLVFLEAQMQSDAERVSEKYDRRLSIPLSCCAFMCGGTPPIAHR
jgi:predicted transposase YdaD